MFDFAWSEIGLIALVAVVLIGPKDLPVAMKALADVMKKARRMAGEFQTHVDEMMREANLQEVRQSLDEIRNFDFKGEVERAVDPDRTIRDTFAQNPLHPDPAAPAASAVVASETTSQTAAAIGHVPESPAAWLMPGADAATLETAPFVVPQFGPASPISQPTSKPAAPSFIPPGAAPPSSGSDT